MTMLMCNGGGDSEHRIKELKLGLHANRLSCHRFRANQFRLLLTQAAYVLMLTLRRAAAGTQLAHAQPWHRIGVPIIHENAPFTKMRPYSHWDPFGTDVGLTALP